MADHPMRQLPSVNQVLQNADVVALVTQFGHTAVADAVRATLDHMRSQAVNGSRIDLTQILQQLAERLIGTESPRLRRVINATGVLLHTNLGRSPLADIAVKAATEAAGGYLNLELDLETGKRSQRQDIVRGWICRLLGCESATVVNNCAAATVLVLRALASGREVIVSRGELVEIGGSFRMPEIMATSGAILREVGATNITRIEDYERAITPQTAMILRVHQSNYRIRGFVAAPSLNELIELAHRYNLPFVDDIGSGALIDYAQFGLGSEPLATDSIQAGADLVFFSGDKLLGGPQAGIIAGRKEMIDVIEREPLMRAFRVDKMTLAALEATLRIYLRLDLAMNEIPVLRQLNTSMDELRRRAQQIVDTLKPQWTAEVRDDETFVGGGSLPDQAFPTVVVALTPHDSADALARRLRLSDPAVLARVQSNQVLLDLRSVLDGQLESLIRAVSNAAG